VNYKLNINKKPKIAVVLPVKEVLNAKHAGAIALCFADFIEYSRYKHDTVIFGTTDSVFLGLTYRKIANWKRWYLRNTYAYAASLASIIIDGEFTHVEVQNRPLTFNYLAKRLPSSVAICLHLHNDPQGMNGLKSSEQRQVLLDKAAAIYCVSNFIKERYIDSIGHGTEKVHVVYNGVDTEKYPVVGKEKTILYVGRTIQEKGILPLAKALLIVNEQLPDWKFIVSGADRTKMLSPYERMTHSTLANLGEKCRYTGYVAHHEVMELFSKAAITLVPSIWQEPFGRTALEAMVSSSAVITSGSGGLKEVVGDVGLIVYPVTPEGLAQAILRLAKDDVMRKEMQLKGYARALEKFDIRKVSAQLDVLREKLLFES
jgi:glycosyltransferase involved in cell wall biosynthesis